ncbi:hypothetical protein L198_01231 [Cryptococcus wingfieldii CBS 7118]|uniref:Tubby C-terminal-like domain-containing protein n=1 Tax=Cryptococcus wingfieldii CBS 7118 TaxID=1295528 RepID=A0A1E3K3H0_9TREE|nr:hypothetical protein L198_01231 [Cryptococcus wingfieldii CBS 7118]ODO07650.1 hypothetical protein L198_01231 [Cryptococcus wingfieldii CBS 7118]
MGLFFANDAVDLQPVSPPLGVHLNHTAQKPTTLVLKESVFSWTGDNFSVKDTEGHTVVKCSGKAVSFRDRKEISDAHGNFMFAIRNKLIAIHKTFVGEDKEGNDLFKISKKWGVGSHMVATFKNASNGQDTTLVLRGDFWGGSADIKVDNGPVVAQITRKVFNAREYFGDKQTYMVNVAPGVDLALIAAVCICFDEAKNENEDKD